MGLLGGVAFLVAAYVRNESLVAREQLRVMVVGVSAAVAPFLVLSVAPSIVTLPPFVRPEIAVLATVLVPLSFMYALMRRQFMAIRWHVHRGMAYALVGLAVLVIYGGLMAFLGTTGGEEVGDSPAIQGLLLVVLFAVIPFTSGTRRLAFAAVDRALYRGNVNHPDLTRRVSIDAAYSQHTDDLGTKVLGALTDELRLSFAAFIGVSDGRPTVKASSGEFPDELTHTIGAEAMESNGHTVSLTKLPVPTNGGQAAIVTLKRREQDSWVLCLGPKVTEEPFRREDIELAQSITGHIATIVEKLELLEEVQTKALELRELNRKLVHTQELERSRIASYLHDEPLQEITQVVWQYGDSHMTPSVQEALRRISVNLRNFTLRLHPALLEDLGLVRSLEALRSETGATNGFSLHFQHGNIGRDERLPSDVELSLYRIAQEAVTNCRRHADASNVWMRLRRNGRSVAITVEDDGVGFPAASGSDPKTRLGLVGMRERAEQLGGRLRISARQPAGTVVEAVLPLQSLQPQPDETVTSLP